MHSDLQVNIKVFLALGITFLVFSLLTITEISLKTGLFKKFEEIEGFNSKRELLIKRFTLIAIFFSCGVVSFLSFWRYFEESVPKEFLTKENAVALLVGLMLFFGIFYKLVRPWKEDDDEESGDEVESIGKKDF